MSTMIRRVGIGMAAACLAATGADVAQAQAISTDVECTDTLQGKRIKGDVTVPSGASCTLSGVQVVGNVTAAADTRLVVSESKIRGDVVVNGLGAVNTPQPSTAQLTDSIITGQLTQTSATTVTVTGSRLSSVHSKGGIHTAHLTLENTEVNSDIVARHRSDVTVENSQVHGNLSTQGDTVVRSSDVDGAAVVDAYASRLCGSQFADLSVSTYYGATIGDGQAETVREQDRREHERRRHHPPGVRPGQRVRRASSGPVGWSRLRARGAGRAHRPETSRPRGGGYRLVVGVGGGALTGCRYRMPGRPSRRRPPRPRR